MTPANLALRIDQGATFRALLRLMQPNPVYKPITDIAPTGPVRLTVEHGLPGDWPVWVEHVRQLPEANRAPLRQLPHMAQVVTATELDLPGINATGTRPEGGQLVYRPPLDLTDATAELRLYEEGAEVGTLPVTVNAGGWVDVELSAAETDALAWRSREYVLDVTLPNGDVLRAYTGTLTVEVAGAAAGQVCHGFAVVGGDRGPAGPTISAAIVDTDGHLILTLQDGTEIDAGVIDRPWGTILGDITQQLDLMTQLGLKVSQDTYSTFVAATNNALGDRYTKAEADAAFDQAGAAAGAVGTHEAAPDPHPQYTTAAEAAASAPVQTVQGRTGDVAITKADVGLGSVDNTSDMAKPVSTAQAAALALKVNVSDVLDQLESADATKPLSANQGRVLKGLIDNIQTLLESDNINLDSLQEVVDFIEQNREDLQNLGISNIAGLQAALDSKADTNGDYVNLRARSTTADDVGLGQADNTPDASKPISGPQQAALDGKVGTGDSRLTNAREWTATTVSQAEAEAGAAATRRAWTAQRVRQAVVAWWNSITSAFGRSFVASADAAAGRTALGLGTFATADYAAAPLANIMPDSGRLGGKTNPLAYPLPSAFSMSPFFSALNSAVITEGGKFIHDNSTNGGAAGALTAPVIRLLAAMGRTGAEARYGVEFYSARIVAGAGESVPSIGTDAVTRYLITTNGGRVIASAGAMATAMFWLDVVSGSVHMSVAYYLDGSLQPAGTPVPAGVHHIRVVLTIPRGYDNAFPKIFAVPGTEMYLSLPVFQPGYGDIGLHTSPIQTYNELSA